MQLFQDEDVHFKLALNVTTWCFGLLHTTFSSYKFPYIKLQSVKPKSKPLQTVLNIVSLTISTLLCCSDLSLVSSKDCERERGRLSLLDDVVTLLSSLGIDGNKLLSLMLFMVAATLGIALRATKKLSSQHCNLIATNLD